MLADSTQEKGSAFERLMVLILDKLGYTDIRTKVHTTGMELDIEARHKVTGRSVLCECKAHVEEIGTDELKKFLGTLAHERSIHKDELGMFFSLSGFKGTARRWYDELDDEHKEFLKIYDNFGIFELLKQADVIIDEQEIKTIIEKNTDNVLG